MANYHQQQQITAAHLRRSATIELWAKVYTAYCGVSPEVAVENADRAVQELEKRFPQSSCLSLPKETK